MYIVFEVLCLSSFHPHNNLGSRLYYLLSFSDLCPQNQDHSKKGHRIQTRVTGVGKLIRKVCPGEMTLELNAESLERWAASQEKGEQSPGGRKGGLTHRE